MSKKVSNKELIDNLKELVDKLGRAPKQKELVLGKYSQNAYKRAFGTYANALKEIGLDAKIKFGLSNKDIIDDIIRVSDDLGRAPSFIEFTELSKTVSANTVHNRFGSWHEALAASGITIINERNIKKEQVVSAIRTWFEENDCDLGCLEYWAIRKAKTTGDFPYSVHTIYSRFNNKSWETIMRECGYDYTTIDQFFQRGFFVGEDGTVYLSSLEKQIGDCLFNLKKGGMIKNYEYEKKVCASRHWTCDFFVVMEKNNIWLEVDGMLNNRRFPYLSGKNEKIEYYKDNGFNFSIISYRTPDVVNEILKMVQEESF